MKLLGIELQKTRRTGLLLVLPAAGVLGAGYAFANFFLRRDTLLHLPLPPMDILLTQLYGMILILNLFGIVAAACIAYDLEFRGNALRKMSLLPVSAPRMYLCKFLLLAALLAAAVALQNLALLCIGRAELPPGAFELGTLVRFAGYSFVTSLPVLAFQLLVASRCEAIWLPLGAGVLGFLSGMALSTAKAGVFLADPFVVMLRPALAMSAQPDAAVAGLAVLETLLFLAAGLWAARNLHFE